MRDGKGATKVREGAKGTGAFVGDAVVATCMAADAAVEAVQNTGSSVASALAGAATRMARRRERARSYSHPKKQDDVPVDGANARGQRRSDTVRQDDSTPEEMVERATGDLVVIGDGVSESELFGPRRREGNADGMIFIDVAEQSRGRPQTSERTELTTHTTAAFHHELLTVCDHLHAHGVHDTVTNHCDGLVVAPCTLR